jgi:peptide/nickel transport system permease protein
MAKKDQKVDPNAVSARAPGSGNNFTMGEVAVAGVNIAAGEEIYLPPKRYWASIVRLFAKNKIAVVGLAIFVIILILCLFAPLFTPFDPVTDMDLMDTLKRPGTEGHLLGTDDLGRDIWCRLLYGGRTSVLTGITITLLSAAIGVSLGLIAGYFGGIVETLIMRFTDIMLSFPLIVIAIAIMAALGSNQRNVIISLAIVSWPGFCRLTRGQVLSLRVTEYIESARVAGFRNGRIIFRHLLPNCMGPLIIQATMAVGGAILSAATLSYLGLGADAAAPDWGLMLSQGKNYLQLAPYLTTIPGIAISLTVLAMNWVGDGLRDAFDPKMRK